MLVEQAMLFRLSAFVLILFLMLSWESWRPAQSGYGRGQARWRNNLALAPINIGAAALLGPLTAVNAASWAQAESWGLLPRLIDNPYVLIGVAIVLLDLAIYAQHRLAHRLPWFWRLHRVHHADPGFDVTTAVRFHPLEILVSILIKTVVIVLLGAPVVAVILFEILLNGMAMFNHANVNLSARAEKTVRSLWVTPAMHRIHHSLRAREHHSNFGFSLSVWDRLFKTYTASAHATPIQIGLRAYPSLAQNSRLWSMLGLPFHSKSRAQRSGPSS